jgi:hypothetical protein
VRNSGVIFFALALGAMMVVVGLRPEAHAGGLLLLCPVIGEACAFVGGIARAESPRAHARPPPVAIEPTYTSARASRAQISTIQSATIAKTTIQARLKTLWSRKSWLRSMLDNATKTNRFSKEEARLCTAGLLLLNTESPKQVSAGSRGAARQYH